MRGERVLRLAAAVPIYARIAWWGIAAPRLQEKSPLRVVQAVVLDQGKVLLAVRSDLRGWELPGGNAHPGEAPEAALVREVYEETGIRVQIERHVGDYERMGFRPHTARVFACGRWCGEPRPSAETTRVQWFPVERIPRTLFPWYRAPLADALAAHAEPVLRRERQGIAAIGSAMAIDLRMRLSNDRA